MKKVSKKIKKYRVFRGDYVTFANKKNEAIIYCKEINSETGEIISPIQRFNIADQIVDARGNVKTFWAKTAYRVFHRLVNGPAIDVIVKKNDDIKILNQSLLR